MSDDTPPALTYRCGTMLLGMTTEQRQQALKSIRDQEQTYIDWVRTHPAPLQKWLETVERLKQRQTFEAMAAEPDCVLGKVLQAMAAPCARQATAEVVILQSPTNGQG